MRLAVSCCALLGLCVASASHAQSIPDIGFDADVSDAAVAACMREVKGMTGNDPEVVASELSQANATIYLNAPAPWKCNVSNSGSGVEAEPMSGGSAIPDVGYDPDVSDAAVEACRKAVERRAGSDPEIVGSEFSQANSIVYLRSPKAWKCIVGNNGRGAELEAL